MGQLFEVTGLIVRGALLPALPEDAHPFEGQRTEDGPMALVLAKPVGVRACVALGQKSWRKQIN